MNITLHNYEAWFLDYLEGNLSESQLAKFYAFLDQHPELKEELDIDLEEVTLPTESVEFIPKTDLHKELELGTITHQNIDFYLIAELEGELTSKQEIELAAFLSANKQYQKDQALYAKTKLPANETIVYPFKRELKKSAVLIRSIYVRYAAAAAILLLFAFAGWQLIQQPKQVENPIASNTPNKEELQPNSKNILEEGVEDANPIENLASNSEIDVAPRNEIQPEFKNELVPSNDFKPAPEIQVAVSNPENSPKESPKRQNPALELDNLEDDEISVALEVPVIETPGTENTPINSGQTTKEKIQQELDKSTGKAIAANNHNQSENNLLDFAGRKLKKDVIGQENVTDGKFRENDVVAGLTKGLAKVTNANIDYKDESTNKTISYGFSYKGFGFSRTKVKK